MTTRPYPIEYPKAKREKRETKGLRHFRQTIKRTLSKYVTFDEDGIFADPDWPHLWDHKR